MFDNNLRQRVENFTHTSIPDRNKQEDTNSSRCGKKYKLQCIFPAFMTSTAIRNHLPNVIRIIETCRESQENIDKTYNELCRVIIKKWSLPFLYSIGQKDHVKNFELTNHSGSMNTTIFSESCVIKKRST